MAEPVDDSLIKSFQEDLNMGSSDLALEDDFKKLFAYSKSLEDLMKKGSVKAVSSEIKKKLDNLGYLNIGSSDLALEDDFKKLFAYSKSLEDLMKKGVVKAVSSEIKNKLDNWENEQVNIAVIGRAGVGKSTYINAIRGNVQPYSAVYAHVGHKETTDNAAPYPHPDNKNLVFWDLPGAGTKTFPCQKYLSDKRVNFRSYDVYIILSSERFTEDDTWLAEEIHKLHKTFLFVRSKVDSEIINDELLLKENANPRKAVRVIRDDCEENLKTFRGFDKTRDLYLFGSLQPTHPLFEFDKLCRRLVDGLPELKGEALLFSLNIMAPEILEAKIIKSLRNRIWGMGLLSAISGAVPIPGVGLAADAALIAGEAHFYRKQLGIRRSDLKEVSKIVDMPVDKVATKFNIKSFAQDLSTRAVIGMTGLLASEVVESAMSLTIPVIGIIAGGVISFGTTVKILRGTLKMMKGEAYTVLKLVAESLFYDAGLLGCEHSLYHRFDVSMFILIGDSCSSCCF